MTFRFCLAGALVCAAISAILAPAVFAAPRGPSAHGQTADLPVASDVRVGGDNKQTRFVMDLSRKIDVATFTLADPYRVVVDLPQVVFKLSANAGEHGRGLIKAFRYGLIMQGGSRIVLDTKGPVRVAKAFALAAADGQPARLVLDLTATDRASFLHTVAVETRTDRGMASRREPAAPAPPPTTIRAR